MDALDSDDDASASGACWKLIMSAQKSCYLRNEVTVIFLLFIKYVR